MGEREDEERKDEDLDSAEDTPEAQELDSAAEQVTELTWGDRLLADRGELSPRHRKLAELAAQGRKPAEICRELGYSNSRVSVLLSNTRIKQEIERIRERIYEDTIGRRLREMAEPALANVEFILTDRSNRVKVSERADMSKWVLEKLDGKAVQKHDVGENILGVLMDKLDAMKSSGAQISQARASRVINVTPTEVGTPPVPALPPPPKSEEELLDEWISNEIK